MKVAKKIFKHLAVNLFVVIAATIVIAWIAFGSFLILIAFKKSPAIGIATFVIYLWLTLSMITAPHRRS